MKINDDLRNLELEIVPLRKMLKSIIDEEKFKKKTNLIFKKLLKLLFRNETTKIKSSRMALHKR